MFYDYCIIGGGIAGLYCAINLVKKHNVILCEKYKDVGGRVSTHYEKTVQYEQGAGRISKDHTLLLELIKRYKLTLVPISSEIHYKKDGTSEITENYFEPTLELFLTPLKNLSKETLQNNTIRTLLRKIHGKSSADSYLNRFPYRAEVDVLRADVALEVFSNEMKSHEGYYVLGEGLSELIKHMKEEFLNAGGKIANHYECIDIKEENNSFISKFLSGGFKTERKEVSIHSEKVVCALHSEALKKIPYFKDFSLLQKVKMEPLLRTYAIYPTNWFKNLGRIVTDLRIRYFLPVSDKCAMISYTDSSDTEEYNSILKDSGENALGKVIQDDLKVLFPEIDIPNYKAFHAYYWKNGATYWLPGDYDAKKESKQSIKPFDCNLFIVGELFSMKQAWMEGALEQSELFLKQYI